jgi:hypothetical protein
VPQLSISFPQSVTTATSLQHFHLYAKILCLWTINIGSQSQVHLPYSSPPHLHLYPWLNPFLGGWRFSSDEELSARIDEYFQACRNLIYEMETLVHQYIRKIILKNKVLFSISVFFKLLLIHAYTYP